MDLWIVLFTRGNFLLIPPNPRAHAKVGDVENSELSLLTVGSFISHPNPQRRRSSRRTATESPYNFAPRIEYVDLTMAKLGTHYGALRSCGY